MPDLAHHVGGGDGHVEVEEAPFDAGHEVVGADLVGAGGAGLGGGVTRGEDHHPGRAPRAGRQAERAPDDLVGLAGVDPEAHGELDGLVELDAGAISFTRSTASAGE